MTGYSNIRYDYENSPATSSTSSYMDFPFTPPSVNGDMFASVHAYEDMVVPASCYESGKLPLIDMDVFKGSTRLGYKMYYYQFSKPYLIPVSS